MAPKLYYYPVSTASRTILMLDQALNLNLEHVLVDLLAGEQHSPVYVKINPHKKVPALVEENGAIILDSHVIASYLCDKYGKDDSLYPKDLLKRSFVQHKLHFENGLVFPPLIQLKTAIAENKVIPDSIKKVVIENYEVINQFLEGHDWVCGDNVTIADISLLPTITDLNVLIPIDEKLVNIKAWIKRAEKLPYYGPNKVGCDLFASHMKKLLD